MGTEPMDILKLLTLTFLLVKALGNLGTKKQLIMILVIVNATLSY